MMNQMDLVKIRLPNLGKFRLPKSIKNAIARLEQNKVAFEFEEEDKTNDPRSWSGFRPLNVTLIDGSPFLPKSFESGFEIDLEELTAENRDFDLIEERPNMHIELELCEIAVTLSASPDMPASLATINCFAAALAETAGGVVFDCEAGEFVDEMQKIASVLKSEYVDEFGEV